MRLFGTRVWGNPVGGNFPIATFGSEGHMARLLAISQPGDRLVFVGTKTERTDEKLQGRLLSMAEFGRLRLRTLEYFRKDELDPRDFDGQGHFKFPHGVPIVRGWTFSNPPLVNETIKQRLTMLATPGVEELTDPADVAKILALPTSYFIPPAHPELDRMRRINDALKPTTGPTPSSATYTAEKSAMQPSWTYALQYGKHHLWKVGHALSVSDRVAEINKHIPHEIGIAIWSGRLQQKWPDAITAHAMEQRVFQILDLKRTTGERVLCTQKELEHAWVSAIAGE